MEDTHDEVGAKSDVDIEIFSEEEVVEASGGNSHLRRTTSPSKLPHRYGFPSVKKPYLLQREFLVLTDHLALKPIDGTTDSNRLDSWWFSFQQAKVWSE